MDLSNLASQIPGWLAHPEPWVYGLGAAAGLTLAMIVFARVLPTWLPNWRIRADDAFTYLGAGLATGVSIDGMFRVAGEMLHMHGLERDALCAFMEVALIACALRARRNVKEFGGEGTDGALVWGFAVLTGIFGASVGDGVGALVRFCVPLVAAVMWQRGLNNLRRRERPDAERSIAWRWTTERLAIWLGLAEPAERTTSDVARARRIARLTKVRLALAVLEQDPRSKSLALVTFRGVRAAIAAARLRNLTLGAVEHLKLGINPAVQEEITRTVAAVVLLPELTDPRVLSAKKPEGKKVDASKKPGTRTAKPTVRVTVVPEQRAVAAGEGRDVVTEYADGRPPTDEEALALRLVAAAATAPQDTASRALAMLAIDPTVSHERMGVILGVTRQAVGAALKKRAAEQAPGETIGA